MAMNPKEATTPTLISGKSISRGLAAGSTFLHRDLLQSLDTPIGIELEDVEEEFGNLENATSTISNDLITLATRVEKEMDTRLGSVFEAHQMMLNDPTLKEELQNEIRQNLVSASGAVKAVFLRWEKRFLRMESHVARHKSDDMRDLSNRLSNALAGIKIHPLEKLPPGSILVARRLLPSDTIFLAQNSAAAVLLEYGGAGSHAALFAREMGLPCIADISDILQRIPGRSYVLVDANRAQLILDPSEEQKQDHRHKVETARNSLSLARKRARDPTVTLDGTPVRVFANVGSRADTDRAIANGANGIGLYRTEQAYLGRATPPTEDELLDEMQTCLQPAKSMPVCIRLLDIGADKPLPFIGFLAESNPALGRRGIRLLRECPQLLETQLGSILSLAPDFELSIAIPMATLPSDVTFVQDFLEKLAADRGIADLPTLGAMIETPAAALSARELAEGLDFLSFGTNDLTQYAFAADRENVAVEAYYNDSASAIFRFLQIVHADLPNMPLTLCGELAGQVDHVQTLLDSGIRSLSVAPPLIPTVKETVRNIRIQNTT